MGETNGATDVVVVPAPAAGFRREVKAFHLRNTGPGGARDVTLMLKKVAGSVSREVSKVLALADGSEWDPSLVCWLTDTDETMEVKLSSTGAAPWGVTWEDFRL